MNYIDAHPDEECNEGETLSCAYDKPGNNYMILRNGAWEWNSKEGGTV